MNKYEVVISDGNLHTFTKIVEAVDWFIDEKDVIQFRDSTEGLGNIRFAINARNIIYVEKLCQ